MSDQNNNLNSKRVIQPINDLNATKLIRDKIDSIYGEEPSALIEAKEASVIKPVSKHQKFMRSLTDSGKDIATIQTEWHNYYIGLPEGEKHQVWQEFYASNQNLARAAEQPQSLAQIKNQVISKNRYQPRELPAAPKKADPGRISRTIRSKVTANGQLKAKHHLQSLLFGLGLGALVVVIFLFSFFNEIIIAPFIQPSRSSASVPVIIGDGGSIAPTPNPEVIIPKINVEIPVDYSETSTNEATIENDLEDGVVHYPSTVLPGQNGNAAFFGHSSNNIFNPGKYKFAFVLLHTIIDGDTFYLSYNHTVFVYKVISTSVVSPNDVAVLGSVSGQTATATLITCDPPGTSLNRLVVVGQQISPNPTTDTTPTVTEASAAAPTVLPGNGPTLLSRFIGSTEGKLATVVVSVFFIIIVFRYVSRLKEY
jgi:LPXTG-site transpeptidase (sortase) family protein